MTDGFRTAFLAASPNGKDGHPLCPGAGPGGGCAPMARASLRDARLFDRDLRRNHRRRIRRARSLGGTSADSAPGAFGLRAQRGGDPLGRPYRARMRDIGASRFGPVEQGAGPDPRNLAQHGEDPPGASLREAGRAEPDRGDREGALAGAYSMRRNRPNHPFGRYHAGLRPPYARGVVRTGSRRS